jgi:membrane-associated protease RseP (regulator of RpoE activity)
MSEILQLIAALLLSLLVHEGGHLLAALITGVRVERVQLFLGYPLVQWHVRRIPIALGWLPLGAFVVVKGMHATPGDTELQTEFNRYALPADDYRTKRRWQKALLIVAGCAGQLLFCVALWGGDAVHRILSITGNIGRVIMNFFDPEIVYSVPKVDGTFTGMLEVCGMLCLVLAIVNLMPYGQTDGARLLKLFKPQR